ncbi:MAG: GNAT family N-acetyltransferase [Planctomycetes bacterium]|nr:GNAT family N-acetyltransferase [Planctomycetota bacterium]
MQTEVITYYLEMTDASQVRPKRQQRSDLLFMEAKEASPEFGRFLYTAVGGGWYWRTHLKRKYDDWMKHLARPELSMWVLYASGTPAGYVEVERQGSEIEILSFGLVPQFVGQGLGAHLLTETLEIAWSAKPTPSRVWLHTCTLDNQPAALNNYKARGMRLYDERTMLLEVEDRPPGPWPGAFAK